MVIVVITAIIMVVGSDPWCATMGKEFYIQHLISPVGRIPKCDNSAKS